MADATITPSNVVPTANTVRLLVTAGEVISAGEVVYLDTVTGQYKLAFDSGTLAESIVAGMALCNSVVQGQPLVVATSGTVALGSGALSSAQPYFLSTTPGKIQLTTAPVSGRYSSIIGVATSASNLTLDLLNSGVQVA